MNDVLVQVLPRLDGFGVANHARRLAAGLEQVTGMRSRFIIHKATDVSPAAVPPYTVAADREELARALADSNGSPVLFHYSNYGYEKRGCPVSLLAAMTKWRNGGPRGKLVTIFHELYATGRPWQSSFWLSPVQRRLARQMRALTDVTVTSLARYRKALEGWRPGAVCELPVFSTVGEPETLPAMAERQPRMIVFGSSGLRARAYRYGGAALLRAARTVGAREIVDVGGGRVAPESVGALPVRIAGQMSDGAISELLSDSRAGFLTYPADFLGKSTVYAAYCAHRMLPIVWWRSDEHRPPAGWNPDDPWRDETEAIADRALAWYSSHSFKRQIQQYASLLQ